MYLATGSFNRTWPRSISCMIAVVVATTLVREARSKMVSSVMVSRRGSRDRLPNALRYITCPLCHTINTAPGIWPWRIPFCTMESRTARRFGAPALLAVAACALEEKMKLLSTQASRQNAERRIGEFVLIMRISRLYTTVTGLLKNRKLGV